MQSAGGRTAFRRHLVFHYPGRTTFGGDGGGGIARRGEGGIDKSVEIGCKRWEESVDASISVPK